MEGEVFHNKIQQVNSYSGFPTPCYRIPFGNHKGRSITARIFINGF